MSEKTKTLKKAFLCAFPHTIPIFAGFWFLGMTYGIYMNVSGFSFWYPMVMSLIIFAGSIEFVAVNMLLGAFNPLQALAMTLMINARHLFYGISMLDRFRGMGWKKIYLIFGMCDETFSINYTAHGEIGRQTPPVGPPAPGAGPPPLSGPDATSLSVPAPSALLR